MMEKDKPPEWQDPQFLKEIEVALNNNNKYLRMSELYICIRQFF